MSKEIVVNCFQNLCKFASKTTRIFEKHYKMRRFRQRAGE